MAASIAAGVGSLAPVRNASGLASSSAFGASLGNVSPLRPVAAGRKVVAVRAALPESGKSSRRETLVSLMAASAALATVGSSFAASGPGIPGAQRTAEKAGDLLKAADELTTNDSPPRFGPGRIGEADDTSRIAQKGGAGAIESLQNAGGASIERSKKAVSKAKANIDKVFGRKSTGDLSDASSIIDDLSGKVQGKVSSDVDAAQSKVKSDVLTSKDKADSFVADAQSKTDSASKDGKGIFNDIVENIKGNLAQ